MDQLNIQASVLLDLDLEYVCGGLYCACAGVIRGIRILLFLILDFKCYVQYNYKSKIIATIKVLDVNKCVRFFFVSFVFNICVGAYVVIAQGPWKAWPCRLDAIVADGHPVLDLKYFEVQPRALPLGGSS